MPKAIPLPAIIVDYLGQTLLGIAARELGDHKLWPVLAAANNLKPGDRLQPGDIIVIGGARPVPDHDRRKRTDGREEWH